MSAPVGPELRDIHLPPAPAWWPPAPGWWLLATLVLVALFFGVRWLWRRRQQQRWYRRVQIELERVVATHAARPDPTALASAISQLLRRASLLVDPRAAAFRGDTWLDFLDANLPAADAANAPFRSGAGRVLVDAPYRRTNDPTAPPMDAPALIALARGWLAHALRGRASHA
jgi:hypothetical protein